MVDPTLSPAEAEMAASAHRTRHNSFIRWCTQPLRWVDEGIRWFYNLLNGHAPRKPKPGPAPAPKLSLTRTIRP